MIEPNNNPHPHILIGKLYQLKYPLLALPHSININSYRSLLFGSGFETLLPSDIIFIAGITNQQSAIGETFYSLNIMTILHQHKKYIANITSQNSTNGISIFNMKLISF